MLDFPSSPTTGQVFQSWTYDGEKWLYTTAPSVAGAVRFDLAQGLTSNQQIQARQNIYAAPFDAMAFSGMQINGAMDVSQEKGNTSFAVAAGALTYVQDGWRCFYNSAPLAMTAYPQWVGSPLPIGFSFSLALGATTGKPTLAAGDRIILDHLIEGYRVARLGWGAAGVQPISIGFFAYATIPGTMAVTIMNAAGNRCYVSNVTVNAASTWEYKTLTVPGDVAGTWAKDNTTGMIVRFCFGAGATYQGAAGSWLSTEAEATSATTNFFATTNNAVAITGVVVLPGIEVPSAARSALVMRPYAQELLTCKRYWQKLGGSVGADIYLRGYHLAGYPLYSTLTYPVEMRAVPAGAVVGAWTLINAPQVLLTCVAARTLSFGVVATVAGDLACYTANSGCFISLDARL